MHLLVLQKGRKMAAIEYGGMLEVRVVEHGIITITDMLGLVRVMTHT